MSLNDHNSYAIVQIQGIRYDKGEEIDFDDLYDTLPCHSCWDDLVEPIKKERSETDILTLMTPADARFLEDAIAIDFSSVGDWEDSSYSFFNHEREMVGLDELVAPYFGDIIKAIRHKIDTPELWGKNRRTASMLTLWSCHYYEDYFGEGDQDISYWGEFDPQALRRMMNDVDRTKTGK